MREYVLVCLVAGCSASSPTAPATTTTRATTAAQPEQRDEADEANEANEANEEPEVKRKHEPGPTCIAVYSFDSDRSVLDEQRGKAGAARWDDFVKGYDAAYLDPDTQQPVALVDKFRIGDTPLLWFSQDFSQAVVNAAVLTPLTIVNATELDVGARAEIGALTELGLGKIGGRELAEFLLHAGVIQTWVHIGSTVCLVDEREDAGGYRGEFIGEHTYFTNEENVDAFAFVVELDAEGKISITGAPERELPEARPVSSAGGSKTPG